MGLIRVGASMIAFLTYSKEFIDWSVQFISASFLSMTVIFFTSSEKLGMNLLTKFIFPKKDSMSLFDLGIESY